MSFSAHVLGSGFDIGKIFPGGDILSIVSGFDFSKINVKDTESKDYLHTDLAPGFGDRSPESVKAMDKHLLVMATGVTKAIGLIPVGQRSWERILESVSGNSLIEPFGDPVIGTEPPLIKKDTNWFKFDGSADKAIVEEVMAWFRRLINDPDVIDLTPIDLKGLANIVAQTGAEVDWSDPISIVYKRSEHRKKALDIGVIRYPDIVHPYLKIYRLELEAWSLCERITGVQNDSNGITGTFQSRKYRPRKEIMDKFRNDVIDKAVSEGEALLLG